MIDGSKNNGNVMQTWEVSLDLPSSPGVYNA